MGEDTRKDAGGLVFTSISTLACVVQTVTASMTPDVWLIVSLGALFAAEFANHPLLGVAILVAAMCLLTRRLGPGARLVLLGVVAASVYRAHVSMGDFLHHREVFRSRLGASERCSGRGEITESPTLRQGRFVLLLRTEELECAAPMGSGEVLRLVGGPDGLARGDRVHVRCAAWTRRCGTSDSN
ncbi:MAG: hypothetical protein QM784_34035 [Polyangiaceae bacterium]